jgi:hypothetical protein
MIERVTFLSKFISGKKCLVEKRGIFGTPRLELELFVDGIAVAVAVTDSGGRVSIYVTLSGTI